MLFADHLKTARAMADAAAKDTRKIDQNLRELAQQDPRFAAVLAVCLLHRERYIGYFTAQEAAPHHGLLAHGAGNVFAVDQLLARFKAIIEAPASPPSDEPLNVES